MTPAETRVARRHRLEALALAERLEQLEQQLELGASVRRSVAQVRAAAFAGHGAPLMAALDHAHDTLRASLAPEPVRLARRHGNAAS